MNPGVLGAQTLDYRRQVIAQDKFRGPDPNGRDGFLAQARGDRGEVLEKRPDKCVEFLPFGGEPERTALKQLGAEILLEQQDLAAESGLLDAVRHALDRAADAAAPSHIIEQLQKMDVHGARSGLAPQHSDGNALQCPGPN